MSTLRRHLLMLNNSLKIFTHQKARELEALLVEYEYRGYRVFTIQPIVTPVQTSLGPSSKTDGLMVVFEKETA